MNLHRNFAFGSTVRGFFLTRPRWESNFPVFLNESQTSIRLNIYRAKYATAWTQVFLLFFCSVMMINLTSCTQSGRGKGHQSEMSPGPSGGFLDRDYRLPIVWLESRGQYSDPGDYARLLTFGGRKRFYEVHIPPQYRVNKGKDNQYPLVLALHGGGGNPGVIRYETRMNDVSDRTGFIVVYPAGTGVGSYDRILYWNSGPLHKDASQRDVDDVQFIARVLDDVSAFFSIDPSRIYATGLSNGAQMSFRLASELSDRISAIGPVAGDRTIGQFFGAPPRPFPVIAFHGKQDTYLSFNGGEPTKTAFEALSRIPVAETIKGWVIQAGGSPDKPEITTKGHAVRYHYEPKSSQGTEVDFWVLEDGGHTWPGGQTTKIEAFAGVGHINQDIFASEVMWEFFQRHRLPPRLRDR
ncbi:MAG: alpha/beta hydrolase family esterase [Methylococcales bacterium]